ncbi:MAG TPA: hypothetical protein VMZ52_13110 [Bryobacteraceae bacterium]|nr:hypothetical protein [Bryobacteraceae bacterium]
MKREFQRGGTRLQEVRQLLVELRHTLATPTPAVLDECAARLAEAIALLRDTHAAAAQESAGLEQLARDLREVQIELDLVRKLMEQAASFHAGWAALLSMATGGYTARGEAAPLRAVAQLSVSG